MEATSFVRDPKHRKLLFSAGLSWLFDAMDVGLVSFVLAALKAEWHLLPSQGGLLTATQSIGMAAGAAAAGALADRYGRRDVLFWTLLIFSAASGFSALAGSFAALCALRFVAGFGLGGELPVASTLVSESVPASERGRAVVLLESFWAAGWLAAAVIAYLVIPAYGWRIAFVIGAVPALFALYIRRTIADSPRYLREKKERRLTFRERFSALWSAEHRRNTVTLWILWFTVVFSYYGMFLWLPSIMMQRGFTMVSSFRYVLIMTVAQLPGYFTAAYLIEKAGRKFVLTTYLFLTAGSALWFGNAATEGSLLAAGICLSFFNLGAWGAMYAYTPELYPTSVRATGVGMAASFGRIGGVIGPYLVGELISLKASISSVFFVFFVAIVVGALTVAVYGKETKASDPDPASGTSYA